MFQVSFTDVLRRRIFELLGYDEFLDGHDDGLQVLRYNKTKAYVQHMDYLKDDSGTQLFVSPYRARSLFFAMRGRLTLFGPLPRIMILLHRVAIDLRRYYFT